MKTDTYEKSEALIAAKGSFVIVDGSFSLRKELYEYWDYSIYLKVDFENAVRRAGVRDAAYFGSKAKAIETTQNRYHAAHILHNRLELPWEKASTSVNNNNPLFPDIV